MDYSPKKYALEGPEGRNSTNDYHVVAKQKWANVDEHGIHGHLGMLQHHVPWPLLGLFMGIMASFLGMDSDHVICCLVT